MSHHKHHHHHHLHAHAAAHSSLNTAFKIGIGLNIGFVAIETVFGLLSKSMGLLSDAGHNLSDVFALILSMVAFRMAKRKPDDKHTYGFRKFTIQASLLNALLLYAAVGAILIESIDKLINPTAVDGDTIAWVAGAGVVVNGVTAWLFLKDKEKDLNVKGAFLHMLSDALVSVGVVVAGIIIQFTHWYYVDPIIGIMIALMIGYTTWNLLAESFRLSIDSVPSGIDMKDLSGRLREVEGVEDIHHLHVWALSTTQIALTIHVIIRSPEMLDEVVKNIKAVALQEGIAHSTVEVETKEGGCTEKCCTVN